MSVLSLEEKLKRRTENIESMLDVEDANIIRCHEGGGPEDLDGSLALTMIRTRKKRDEAIAEAARLQALLDTPQTGEFTLAVKSEMAHQEQRWGAKSDVGKEPGDWFALVTYLMGKAVKAHYDRNGEKLQHHLVSSAAALGNFYRRLKGENVTMRPGIEP